MNRETIKTWIDEINALDIWALLKEAYPDEDLSTISIQGWKPDTIASYTERIKNQFNERMSRDDFEFLPSNYKNSEIDPNEHQVPAYLSHLATTLKQKNFLEVVKGLKWLASYQVAYGFWDKSKLKVHDPSTIDLQNKSIEITALQTKIDAELNKVETMQATLLKSSQELQSFYEQKQAELLAVTQARQEVLIKQNEISTILVEINDYKSKADSAFQNTQTSRDESKKSSEESNKYLKDFSKKAQLWGALLEKFISKEEERSKSIESSYEHIQAKRDFIDLKETEIIKLAAQASDGSLGHTFDKRQSKLGSSATFWMIGVCAMTVLLFAWIFIVFKFLSDTTYDPAWVNPLFSTIKTVPAFIILVFIARQYTKERNLQEEYAFKASIAMTLTAYADEIAREDDLDRRAIIKETIEKVYTAPKITNESVSLFGIRDKQLERIAEKTSETINKVIDKTSSK